MATADELRRLGLGLGADPRYSNLRRIFGQPQKQPETVQSTVAPALSSSQSQQPFETYLQQRTGRDGEIYFTPETTNPNASNMQIIYKPEQVFGPTQFINLLKNASKNSTLGRDTDSKTFKPDINLEEVNDNQEAPNFLEMTDEQLVAASLSARGLKNSKGFGILTLAKRGAGSLANRQIEQELLNRSKDVQLAVKISELRKETRSPLSLIDAFKSLVTGQGAKDIAKANLLEARDVLSLESGLENVSARSGPTPAQQQTQEQEALLAAEQFTGPQTQQIADQQRQQEQQQQQQLARQIGQGSVDDFTPDIPTVDGTDPSDSFDPGSGSFAFEEGGKIQKMQEGGEVAEAPAGEGMEMAGLINNPNAAPMGDNADDVPMDVPEDSFIINAEAVQEVGLKDIYKAMDEAIILILKTGLGPQLPAEFKKEDRETVPILASNGEVMIPPIIAKMIGEETLNKWNNKGRAIQEAKAAEEKQRAEQQAQQQQQQAPVMEAPMQQGMV